MSRVLSKLKIAGLGGGKNEWGLTPKQEEFCQFVAQGLTLSDSYRKAYNSRTTNSTTVQNTASNLYALPKVKRRVEDLLNEVSKDMHRDTVSIRRHVFDGLVKESRNMKAKPSERIAALIALGKIDIVGMFRDKGLPDRGKELMPDELEKELRDRFREFFGKLLPSPNKGTEEALASEYRDGILPSADGKHSLANGEDG